VGALAFAALQTLHRPGVHNTVIYYNVVTLCQGLQAGDGAYCTIQKALPLLSRGASVILNGSINGLIGMAGTSVYAASKAALRSFARTRTADVVDRGIRVNVIGPGPVTTPIFGRLGLTPEALEALATRVEQNVPIKRFGNPREIAHAVVFLASDESTVFLGAELVADGGLSQL